MRLSFRQSWPAGPARSVCLAAVLAAMAAFPMQARANPSVKGIVALTGALVGWAASHPGSTPEGRGAYVFTAGDFDRVDRVAQTWSLGFERRWGHFILWRFKPFVGADFTGRRSLYAYGGLRLDLHLLANLEISPSLALTGYLHGGGKILGSPVDFRSGIDVEWRFAGGIRAGIAYHHLSHWVLFGPNNPGTEILAVTISVPIGRQG